MELVLPFKKLKIFWEWVIRKKLQNQLKCQRLFKKLVLNLKKLLKL